MPTNNPSEIVPWRGIPHLRMVPGNDETRGTMDLEKVTEILEAGAFDSLIGLAETHDLEFKGEPYLLDTDFQKRELVKDVTGFANASGGILILGIRHDKNSTHQRDEAVSVGRWFWPERACWNWTPGNSI